MLWIKMQVALERIRGGNLPDFIIAGFQKCATTALWRNLNQHPKIRMAKHSANESGKEFNYFSRHTNIKNLRDGLHWYMSHFKKDGHLWGEASPNYSIDAERSAGFMHKVLPSAKLIFSMRNPVDRAYSALNHYRQIYPKSRNWGTWFPDENFLYNLKHGESFSRHLYARTLRAYLQQYPRERIHLFIQEKLQDNPQEIYDGIFEFLGIESVPIENKTVHSRTYEQALSDEERREAATYFARDVTELEELLGHEIPEWRADFKSAEVKPLTSSQELVQSPGAANVAL